MDIGYKIKQTVKKYNLIKEGEKVVVALSGGKDSTTTLYFLKKLGYDVHALMIHLCMGEWSTRHRNNMVKFCEELDVPITIINFNEEVGHDICYIKDIMKKKKNISGSTVCGIMKRYILNKYAKKMNADKIATGHNLDDEAQNVIMNFLKGNVMLGVNSSPMTSGGNVDGFVQRIKPLYFIPENEIMKFTKKRKFNISYEQCPCSVDTYRAETREWMECLTSLQKEKIVENFLKIAPDLREKNKRLINPCVKCGEPTSGKLCSACSLFVFLK